jgi:hypothetical protein
MEGWVEWVEMDIVVVMRQMRDEMIDGERYEMR